MVRTSPMINPVIITNGSDRYPIMNDCLSNSLISYGGFTNSLKKRSVKIVMDETSTKNRSTTDSFISSEKLPGMISAFLFSFSG